MNAFFKKKLAQRTSPSTKLLIKEGRLCVLSWFVLITLTCLSIYIIDFMHSRSLFIGSALFIVFLKGQQIIDNFMELKHAPKRWRLLLLSYVILIPLIISIIYIL